MDDIRNDTLLLCSDIEAGSAPQDRTSKIEVAITIVVVMAAATAIFYASHSSQPWVKSAVEAFGAIGQVAVAVGVYVLTKGQLKQATRANWHTEREIALVKQESLIAATDAKQEKAEALAKVASDKAEAAKHRTAEIELAKREAETSRLSYAEQKNLELENQKKIAEDQRVHIVELQNELDKRSKSVLVNNLRSWCRVAYREMYRGDKYVSVTTVDRLMHITSEISAMTESPKIKEDLMTIWEHADQLSFNGYEKAKATEFVYTVRDILDYYQPESTRNLFFQH